MIDAIIQTNEWGIFQLPDILTPAGLRDAGLAGKKIRVTVELAEEESE